MSKQELNSSAASTRSRLVHIFAVTGLAAFVTAIVLWPMPRPTYRTQAIIAVEREDGQAINVRELTSRLRVASKQTLAMGTVRQVCSQLELSSNQRNWTDADLEKLRSAIQLGVGKSDRKSRSLVSISSTGSGAKTDVELVNCLANQLVESLKSQHLHAARITDLSELRSQIQLSQARSEGLQDAASLIAVQQANKLDAVKNIKVNTEYPGPQEIANPAWAAIRERLEVITSLNHELHNQSQHTNSFSRLLEASRLTEEFRSLNAHLQHEPRSILFHVEKSIRESTANSDNKKSEFARTGYETGTADSLLVNRNEFYGEKQAADAAGSVVEYNLRLVDHQQAVSVKDSINEIQTQIQTEESRRARLQATVDQASEAPIDTPEVVRLMQPATRSMPTSAGVSVSQIVAMLLLSIAFGGVITWNANSIAAGTVFATAEEVSRKLGLSVLAAVSVDGEKSPLAAIKRGSVVKRIVLVCEISLVVFAVVMISLTLVHSDLATSMRENPLAGLMEAIRWIKPWQ
jgi:hypothetical protein